MSDGHYKQRFEMIVSVIVVVLTTLIIDTVVVFLNPGWMIDDSTILTAYMVPVMSMVIGTLVYALYIKIFGVGWRFMPTILLAALASFIALAVVGRSPEVSGYFEYRYNQSQNFQSTSGQVIGNGNIPDDVITRVQISFPSNWSLCEIDRNSDQERYWFVANNDETGDTLVGFSDKQNPARIHLLTIEQIWKIVQTREALSSNVTYKQFSGLPTPNDSRSSLLDFFQSKTVYFLSSDNRSFKVEISAEGDSPVIFATRQY
jgi:hypothetical protein